MDRPPIECLFFESIHPTNINKETKQIGQAAHKAVDQILVSACFKDWLQGFFFNPSAYVDVATSLKEKSMTMSLNLGSLTN
jgi:hypothetical protein